MLDTRKKALAYLRKKGFRDVSERLVSASKFFKPEESWTGKEAWWFSLPIKKILANKEKDYFLIGDRNKEKTDFVILRVPNMFLIKKLQSFETRYNNMIILHLAAYNENWLVDERGKDKVPFSEFEV